MASTSDALARGARGISAALKRPMHSPLLGGDEPAANQRRAANRKSQSGKPKERAARGGGGGVGGGGGGGGGGGREHDRDNGKVVATCALPAGQGRGPSVRLRPTVDPFDRAHTLRNQVTNALLAAAAGGKRMRPIVIRPIDAAPREYPEALLRTVRILVTVPADEGEELHRVCGEVGPDSQTELQAEYAARVAAETGINLYGGNMAAMVHAALARGGGKHLQSKTSRLKKRGGE